MSAGSVWQGLLEKPFVLLNEFSTVPTLFGTLTDLRGADLRGAVLSEADLSRAYLIGADLREAVLSRANLTGADFKRAVFTGADLTGANLGRAILRLADFKGADLTGTYLRRAEVSLKETFYIKVFDSEIDPSNLAELKNAIANYAEAAGYTEPEILSEIHGSFLARFDIK